MKRVSFFAALPVLCLLHFTSTAQDDKIKEVENNLSGIIRFEDDAPFNLIDRMAFYKIKGLSIAVIQNYQVIWAKGYGWADEDKKIPVTPQTLFQAASISKSLNGVGLVKLVQEKKLDLYADINTYLTSWKFPYDSLSKGTKISVANLLSHTGGLTVHGFPGYEPGENIPSLVDILDGKKPANTKAVRSMYAPGLKSEYSGGGVTISQMILMDITHQSYQTYMDNEVLKPMGMTASTYVQPPMNQSALLATAYNENGQEIVGKYHIYPEQAAAGLWTNPTDLGKYIIETQLALEGRSSKVLTKEMTRTRLTPYIDKSAALGVFINNYSGTSYFQHGGANEGFRCQYFGSLEGGNGLVIMVNSDNNGIFPEVYNSIAKVYDFKGLNRGRVLKNVGITDAMLDSYTGQYELSPNFILTITKEKGFLGAQATGQGKISIYPESTVKFFATNVEAKIEFTKDVSGKVTGLILYQGGQQMEAKKK